MCVNKFCELACRCADEARPSYLDECEYTEFRTRVEREEWEARYGKHTIREDFRTDYATICVTDRFQEDHRKRSGQNLKWPNATKTQW